MSNEVWYRKWRPQIFAEVTGQEHVTRTLRNAVTQGRVAHAYLLCGPRGTGKTTTARVLAKAVNCSQPRDGEPCNACESCRAVNEGRALDLVEMDAASNRGIDDIRNLRDRVGYHPSEGRYRVYLIDEVHELTAQAFDALLKTLEEPPPHIIFVLATTDAHRVPATIVSRCQRFDLTRIKHADIAARLRFIAEQEGVSTEDGALDVIARAAAGGLRDAVNLLEQLIASYGTSLTGEQARAGLGLVADDRARALALKAAEGAFTEGLAIISAVRDDSVELRQFNREVVAHLRALMLLKAGAESGLEGLGADALNELRRSAEGLDARRVLRALKAFSGAEFRGEAQPSLPLELALAEVAFGTEPEPPRAPAAALPPSRPAPVSTAAPVREPPTGIGERPRTPIPPASSGRPAERTGEVAPAQAAETSASGATVPDNGARPAPPPANGVTSLDEARARFRQIYEVCSAMHKLTGAMLNSGCDVVAIDERTLTFGFQHPWAPERLLPGTQSHRILVSAVEQVFGQRLDVQSTHVPNVENRLRALPPSRVSHLLDEARKLGLTPVDRS